MRYLIPVVAVCALTACATNNLSEYTPVVDTYNTDMNKFETDLIQCRGVAAQAKIKYDEQASKMAMQNIIVGVVVGAAIGSAIGDSTIDQGGFTELGAVAGAAAGADSAANAQLIAKYGPNKIVDRCMNNRGYAVLNDVGSGTN
jgi:uncharacterized protein YcfJ